MPITATASAVCSADFSIVTDAATSGIRGVTGAPTTARCFELRTGPPVDRSSSARPVASKGASPMLRQAMITLMTAAALSGGLTADAFARAAGGFGGGAHIGGGFGGGAYMGGAFGGGAHVGGGFGRGHFGGAMGGGRIGGGLRAGQFGGGRFARRFEPSHRVRGLVVPF